MIVTQMLRQSHKHSTTVPNNEIYMSVPLYLLYRAS